jgi:hypothetical protein
MLIVADDGGNTIAITSPMEDDEAAEEANARLIATVPELLAVAREACAIFDANYENEDEYNGDLASDLWKNEIHRKLTEALSKALSSLKASTWARNRQTSSRAHFARAKLSWCMPPMATSCAACHATNSSRTARKRRQSQLGTVARLPLQQEGCRR